MDKYDNSYNTIKEVSYMIRADGKKEPIFRIEKRGFWFHFRWTNYPTPLKSLPNIPFEEIPVKKDKTIRARFTKDVPEVALKEKTSAVADSKEQDDMVLPIAGALAIAFGTAILKNKKQKVKKKKVEEQKA